MNEAQKQLASLLSQAAATAPHFPPESRYSTTALGEVTTAQGRTVTYLRRRFVPPPQAFAQVHEHQVSQGDRLDRLAADYLQDPELFWRLCDANGALRPNELTETAGRRLRITLPEGIPGADGLSGGSEAGRG